MTRRGVFFLFFFTLLVLPASARATACFSNASAPLTGVDISALAWGDYDQDGDLDLLVAGFAGAPDQEYVSRLYRNDAGSFNDIGVGIPGFAQGSVAWGDYDQDGDLDILICGVMCSSPSTRIYRNSGGTNPTFHNVYAGLPGLATGGLAWGDYDNDGDLDIAMCGRDNSLTEQAFIFRSSGGPNPTFTNANAGLTGLMLGSVSWADYDKDGDLDLLVSGYSSQFGVGDRVNLYVNSGGANPTFADVGGPSFAGTNSAVDWGDYDNDGDLDILATGGVSFNVNADIFSQSVVHSFDEIFSTLIGVGGGSARFGDYNNDGKLDALLVGADATEDGRSVIQQAPAFTDIGAGLAGVGGNGTTSRSSAAWGDYDNDGDLDVALAGLSPTGPELARIYRNDCGTANTPPTAPTNLIATVNGNTITFSWSPATDGQTPQAGLTYNLRVGTVPGGSNVISPEADLSTGYRRQPALGNTSLKTSWMLRVPGAGAYYWSVQAIDGSYAGGPFAAAQGTGVTAVGETLTQGALLRVEGPNPLSSAVTIEFHLTEAEHVRIGVYDVAGRLVRSLMDADVPAGAGTRVWDAKDDAGHDVPSGLYLIRLNTPTEERVKKVAVVRS